MVAGDSETYKKQIVKWSEKSIDDTYDMVAPFLGRGGEY